MGFLSNLDGTCLSIPPPQLLIIMKLQYYLNVSDNCRNVDEIYSLELLIKSLLITQNLQFTKLIIWMDEDWIESKISDKSSIIQSYRYTPYQSIQFRRVDLKRLSQSLSQSCGSNGKNLHLSLSYSVFLLHLYYNIIIVYIS